MKLAVPKEVVPGERRVAIVPESVRRLAKAGVQVLVEAGAGTAAMASDGEYQSAGATVVPKAAELLQQADFVAKVQCPVHRDDLGHHEAKLLRPGATLIATLRPTVNLETVRLLAEGKVTAFSTDLIPRTTRAQSMDTLSSQATVAGYKAVLLGAMELGKMFPMFMTAAGTILPAKVFIIGAGVAGLQAIATARRLGANVEATDTRPVVKEQVESLGAKFVGVETTEAAQDAGGYAKELSQDFYRKQQEFLADRCANADLVITTALIGGVKAPKLITEDMVKGMRLGSVIVDLAAEGGGNCVLTEPGRTVTKHGVVICAPTNLPATAPMHASQMYSRNLTTFILEFWKNGAFNLNLDDEIIKGALVTHNGAVVHEMVRKAMEAT